MRYVLIICLLLAYLVDIHCQDSQSRSNKGRLSPVKKEVITETPKVNEGGFVYQVPFLEAEINFSEDNGNYALDASESGVLSVSLINKGQKPAEDCEMLFIPDVQNENIKADFNQYIGRIGPSEKLNLSIGLQANEDLKEGQTRFTLKVVEANGFDLYPEKIVTIKTRKFQPPRNEIVDYGIEDQNRNLKIEKFEVVDVTFRVQNRGENKSKNTYATVELGEGVVAMDVKSKYELGDLATGDFADFTTKIATNARAKDVKINVNIFESTGKFTASKQVELPFETVQKKADDIVIAEVVKTGETFIPDVANLKLDIAVEIPQSSETKKFGVAVIIGNKDYENSFVPSVDFALNDARLMRNYAVKTLGILEENIIYKENATQSDMYNIFGNNENHRGKLYDYLAKGVSAIFVYYSGHGAPNTENNQGYIVPVDCDPNKVALNGYSLSTFYGNLDKIAQEKEVLSSTVVLDACFSGNSQQGSLLKNISPITISIKSQALTYQNSCVITSASGDQVSTWYADKKHSLFTYFFLKGLKGDADANGDGEISTEELYKYTADEIVGVPYFSRKINGRTQTPTFTGVDYTIFK